MKKALVTGVCGFSSGYLVQYLIKQKVAVYGVDIKSRFNPPHESLGSRIKFIRLNLLDAKAVKQLVRRIRPDYIFHLAALVGEHKLESLTRVNVLGTKNLLEAAVETNARVLISGSSAEYGLVSEKDLPIDEAALPQPVNYYGISKLAQTMLGYQCCISKGVKVYLTRVFNMTGPGEPTRMVLASFANQIKMIRAQKIKPIIYVGNLTPKRDFIDVRDVVRAYWLIINRGKQGKIYNICSGEAYSIREVLTKLISISQLNKVIIKQSSVRRRSVEIPVQVGNNSRIKRDTGWKAQLEFEQTLKDILSFTSRNTTS